MSTERTRTKGGFTPPPNYENWRLWGTCAESTFTFQSSGSCGVARGSQETMQDVVIPDFARRRSRGEIFFNDMVQVKRSQDIPELGNGLHYRSAGSITCSGVARKSEIDTRGPGFAKWIANHLLLLSDGLLPAHQLIGSSELADMQTEAATRCLSRRGLSGSGLLESVAQYRQTVKLLRNPFSSLQKLLGKAEKLRKLKGGAEAWLTYRYGILPLCRDMEAIASAIGLMDVGNRRKKEVATLGNQRVETSSHVYNVPGLYSMTYSIQKTDTIMLKAVTLDEYFVSLASNLGFTWKDALTLPWELIPYSFVADWFVNFGDFLKASAPLPGVKPLGSCLVTHRILSAVYTPQNTVVDPALGTLIRPVSGKITSTYETKTRSPLGDPGIVIKSDFKLDDATRLADAVSLFALRFLRCFR